MKQPGPIRLVLGAGVAALAVLGTTLGMAGAAESEPAPVGEIRGSAVGESIDDEYIVVLKERAFGARSAEATAAAVRGQARDLANEYGGSTKRTYTSALEGFSVSMPEAKARELAADPAVAFVEPNRVERADVEQETPTWGLDRVDQRDLPLDRSYESTTDAANVTAYVVDSGIRAEHEDFEGRASYGYNFVDANETASDCNGHGTHVAGTVGGKTHGVAKKVQLVAVKVLGCDNRGTTENVLAGYDWVARNAVAPAVVNVSIGGDVGDAKDAAVRNMVEAGITVAVSAGNKDTDACEQSPAREESALTVAATAQDDSRSSFSNYGECVDLFAPGTGVESAGHESDTDIATMNGTSMATPHVTGVAALYVSKNPEATPSEVAEALIEASTKDRVTEPGAGSPNRLLYSRF